MLNERARKAVLGTAILMASSPAWADDFRLKTLGGLELGGQWSNYRYEEPREMNQRGHKLGPSVAYTTLFEDNTFFTGSLRYGFGRNTRSGTNGALSDVADTLWEGRLVGGTDYVSGSFALSPYLGLGYRMVRNDLRGLTSTGGLGYRRTSEYLYMPIGMTMRVPVSPEGISRIATSAEYDFFIRGKTFTRYSDTGLGLPDVTNYQKGGHGLKASIGYEARHYSVGLVVDYWKITPSPLAYFYAGNALFQSMEPENSTHEYGVFARFRF